MPSMPFHRFLIFLWASFSSHCETLNVNVEPLPQSMATIKKKVRTEQVLVNTCRNWNPCALWVGMNNNSASIRGCLKLKIGLLYIQQFPLWIYVQKNRKPDVSDTFVARVLITVVRGRGQLDCPHVDERINKMWLHILGYWPALTGKCVLTYTTTRMNLASWSMNLRALCEMEQASCKEPNILCDSTDMSRRVKFTKAGNRMVVAGGWGRRTGELLFCGYWVSVWQDEEVLGIWLHNGVNICDTTTLYNVSG